MRKCPACNSTRITKQVIAQNDNYFQNNNFTDDKESAHFVISCAKCGFVNKRDINRKV